MMANKLHIVHCLIVFSFLLISKISFPQNRDYDVKYITTKDGLANGCIQHIIQDSKGFMWFATEGGLNRYDGYNIKLYDCGQGFIKTIFEDPIDSGKVIWIGTSGGLFKFDLQREKFIKYQHNADDPNSISSNDIECIYKDRSGVYWIGTRGGGLNKFDRNTDKFISYRNEPNDLTSINSDNVLTICEDYLGNLWVGTGLGALNKLDRKTNKFIHYKYDFKVSSGLYSVLIRSLYEDSNHTLWVGTHWTLFKYDRENDQFIKPTIMEKHKSLLSNKTIWSMVEDKENSLWIGSVGGGLIEISSDRNNVKNFSDELSSISASSVCIDKSGIIWVGTFCNGINKIVPRKKYFNYYKYILTDSTDLKFEWAYSFFEDKRNDLWIGTDEGLIKLENGKFKYYPILINDYKSTIRKIYQSKNGKLWLFDPALTEFDPQTKKYIKYGKYICYPTPIDDLSLSLLKDSSEIASIKKVKNNQKLTKDFIIDKPTPVMVICFGEGNLSELFDYGWITFESDDNLVWKMNPESSRNNWGTFKDRIQISLLTLKPGRYKLHYNSDDKHAFGDWIGKTPETPEWWGISVFPISSSIYQSYKNEIENIDYTNFLSADFESAVVDNEGKVWCISENTIDYFDQETKQFLPYEIKVKGKIIQNIASTFKDHKGMLWLTTADNILIRRDSKGKCEVKFVLKDFIRDENEKLNNDALHKIYEDSKSNLWIGTDLGLFKYNLVSEKIEQFKFEDFCIPNAIEAIVEDNNGKLWITTSKNLVRFDPEQNVVRKYGEFDGLPNMTFAANSCIKLHNGQIAFGGSNGFIIFDPDSIQNNEVYPEIAITGFQIFNKPVSVGQNSPLKNAITHSDKIVLKYDQDVFTFEFSALDYSDPERNKYAYKMEGVDPDWVYTDANRRFATYTNLDPGSYVFTVKGSNNDGVWNEEGKSILVIITPPWWSTTWAYVFYALLIISIIYFTWKLQLKRIRIKHDYEMSRFEAEKMHEVDGLKSRFFANISHEFRTPLTLILGISKKILDKSKEQTYKDDIGVIKRNANRLHGLVNQLLDLSKLESGSMTLQAYPQNIIPLLKGLVLSFTSFAERKRITLKFNSNVEEIVIYFDKDKIEKIVTNLLSNAFKFTPQGGRIEFGVKKSDANVEITVSDTGIGITPERIDKIFDRFYQVDGSHTREQEGTGLGLALTKELVELHKGQIRVESSEGKGSSFTVTLPLGKEHLKPEEIIDDKSGGEEIVSKEVELSPEYAEQKVSTDIEVITETEKLLLLIVEDNADVRNYIKGNLKEDYRTLEAVDGEDGLNQAINYIPDLIISDVMMPKMDGFEMCDKIKNDERTSHIPVIMLTAKATSKDKIDGYKTGADDYIMKPFDTEELRARINNLIQQRERLREHFKEEGIIRIDDTNVTPTDKIFLKKAFDIINKHLSDDSFSVDVFADEIAMSRSQLGRKLVALVGESPGDLIRRIRLTKAAKLIEEGFGNISEIATEVGFNNPSNFARSFKTQFGVSPSDYLSSKK